MKLTGYNKQQLKECRVLLEGLPGYDGPKNVSKSTLITAALYITIEYLKTLTRWRNQRKAAHGSRL